jgi:hypothetical protein
MGLRYEAPIEKEEVEEASVNAEAPTELAAETPNDPSDYEFWNEKCYLKIGNYREPEGSAAAEEEKKPMDKRA